MALTAFELRGEDEGVTAQFERACLARIEVELPRDRKQVGRTDALDDLSIEVLRADGPMNALAAEEAARLAALGEGDEAGTVITGVVTRGHLWLATYRRSLSSPEPTAVRALYDLGDRRVRMDGAADPEAMDALTSAIAEVAQALRLDGAPGAGSFCLDGVFADFPYRGFRENAAATFDLGDAGALEITTRTNGPALDETLSKSLAEAGAALAALGGAPSAVFQGVPGGSVAKGESARVRLPDAHSLFIWRDLGAPDDPARPFVEIALTTAMDDATGAAWLARIAGSVVPLAR